MWQWVYFIVGLTMALAGGGLKVYEILTLQGALEYVLFSGESYVLMIAGVVLMILALGYELVFGQGEGRSETAKGQG